MRFLPFPKWLVFALLCAFCWGVWGVLTKVGSDRMNPPAMQVLFTLGMFPMVLVALVRLEFRVEKDWRGAAYGILNGVFSGLGLLAFYAAMARGKASIVGPFTALFPLLTAVLAFVFLKERINKVQGVGILLALVSIYILSR
jgi:bacterial/archaeal transporter family protein